MDPHKNTVTTEITKAGIAILTLNRPDAMNALNIELITQLEEQFSKAENDFRVIAIVIRGAGKAFVAGADIKFFIDKIVQQKIKDILSFTRKTSELFLAIENCKKPTIAILDGFSLGGGSELALSCQAIVATDRGSMAFPETAIGIYPGLGGMLRLSRKIGESLAKYYVFTGASISAQDAFDLGIATRLVSAAELDQTIIELATDQKMIENEDLTTPERFKQKESLFAHHLPQDLMSIEPVGDDTDTPAQKISKILKQKAPLALKLANEIIDQQMGKPMKEAIEIELGCLENIFSTQDALEGLSSAGKRKPNYIGK